MDRQAQLDQLRSNTLRTIQASNVRKKRKYDKHSTTSLHDLDLARTPVDPDNPRASRRPWAQEASTSDSDSEDKQDGGAQLQREHGSKLGTTPTSIISQQGSDLPAGKVSAKNAKNSKWVHPRETRVSKVETDSNAWGSAAPSDATRASNISDQSFGKLLHERAGAHVTGKLDDWKGEWMPPPPEWDERPRFNNNNEPYKSSFRHWIRDRERQVVPRGGSTHRVIPSSLLRDLNNCPDGLGMVSRTTTINSTNAFKYGYVCDADPQDMPAKYANTAHPSEFEDRGKVGFSSSSSSNTGRENETADKLVENWLRHLTLTRHYKQNPKLLSNTSAKLVPASLVTAAVSLDEQKHLTIRDGSQAEGGLSETVESKRSKVDMYLRPAGQPDLKELTRIYNWYVEHTPRPVETRTILEDHMLDRFNMCARARLPFLVAVRSDAGSRTPASYLHHDQVVLESEQLMGFICAQDLTCADYVEHITAEVEIYVDPACARNGVGRRLMDLFLHICDPDYERKFNTQLVCSLGNRHLYNPQGCRRIHKFVVQLRKWKFPVASQPVIRNHQRRSDNNLQSRQTFENNYAEWGRRWMEDFDFEVEGVIKGVGAKNGRYVDNVIFGRETSWTPPEGQLPAPDPAYGDQAIAGHSGFY